MDYDALLPLLAERVRALEDILDGMDHRLEQNTARLRDMARLAEIVRQAPAVPGPRHAAPRRPRLYIVHGVAVLATLFMLARWRW